MTFVKNDLGENKIEYVVTVGDKTFSQIIQCDPPFMVIVDVVSYQLIAVPLDINDNSQFLEIVR